jgi:DNA-binding CsgD family transcriptional regulator
MLEASSLEADAFARAVDSLSSQQRQLLRLAAEGHSTKKMLRMGVTLKEGTIDNYVSAATKALGARDRRHAGKLLLAFETQQSQQSHLRSQELHEPLDSDILQASEPHDDRVRQVRDERVSFDVGDSSLVPISPGQSSGWIELIKHSMLLKISCSVALAIGLVIVVAGVGAIASNLQAMRERAVGNMAHP